MLRPYTDGAPNPVDREYPVHMVGHHDELVQAGVPEVPRDLTPTLDRSSTGSVQVDLPLDDVSKHEVAHVDADCDEVDALARVVKSSQPDGPSAVRHPKRNAVDAHRRNVCQRSALTRILFARVASFPLTLQPLGGWTRRGRHEVIERPVAAPAPQLRSG